MGQTVPENPPDPLQALRKDHPNLTLRKKIRRIASTIMAAALVVVLVRGIYVVMQVTKETAP